MDFCPDCETKMVHLKKKQARTVTLILSCPRCGYEKKTTRPNLLKTKVKNYSREKLVVTRKDTTTRPSLMVRTEGQSARKRC